MVHRRKVSGDRGRLARDRREQSGGGGEAGAVAVLLAHVARLVGRQPGRLDRALGEAQLAQRDQRMRLREPVREAA